MSILILKFEYLNSWIYITENYISVKYMISCFIKILSFLGSIISPLIGSIIGVIASYKLLIYRFKIQNEKERQTKNERLKLVQLALSDSLGEMIENTDKQINELIEKIASLENPDNDPIKIILVPALNTKAINSFNNEEILEMILSISVFDEKRIKFIKDLNECLALVDYFIDEINDINNLIRVEVNRYLEIWNYGINTIPILYNSFGRLNKNHELTIFLKENFNGKVKSEASINKTYDDILTPIAAKVKGFDEEVCLSIILAINKCKEAIIRKNNFKEYLVDCLNQHQENLVNLKGSCKSLNDILNENSN